MGETPPKVRAPSGIADVGIDDLVDRDDPDAHGPLAHGSEEHDYDALLREYLRETSDVGERAGLPPVWVLLVDANESSRRSLEEMLGAAGYHVVTARDGEAAFHLIGGLDVQVVLADNALPDVTGFDLRTAVHRIRPGLPVLIMTDDRRLLGAAPAAEQGARGLVEKPVRGLVLLAALHDATRNN